MIYTHIPYSINRNYGKALNDFLSLINDDDWVVIMDYDAMFTHNHWFNVVTEAIKEGDALITCPTNRTGQSAQLAPGVDRDNHDMKYHYAKGKEFYEKYGNEVRPFTCDGLMSGYVMIFPKRLIGRVTEGTQLGIDNEIHQKAKNKGAPVKILPGVYVYHAYFRL